MEQQMSLRHIRIAELVESLEKLTQLIDLHKKTTQNESMIKQYEFKRMELLTELQGLFKPMNLKLEVA
jgi:hypothetical protein